MPGASLIARLARLVDDTRSSFWFVPALMTAGAILLSIATLRLDERGGAGWLLDLRFVYANQPEGARSLLSTIAGSTINVAGVVFSLTIVSLTLASQQFGPRLMGNFMRDRGNQVVLGTFMATFVYCLLVLRTVRSDGGDLSAFVPHLSVTVALAMTLGMLGATIYFIHHIAASIQVQNVIAKIAAELSERLGNGDVAGVFPAGIGIDAGEGTRLPRDAPPRGGEILSRSSGYLQSIDGAALIAHAERLDVVVRLDVRPGDFITEGQRIAHIVAGDVAPDADRRALQGCFSFAAGRSAHQDLDSVFDQLVELALRALSPASNDPVTAVACVYRICDALLQSSRQSLPSPYRAADDGSLRVIAPVADPASTARRVFTTLRSSLAGNLMAARHALDALRRVEGMSADEELGRVAGREHDELLAACREELPGYEYAMVIEAARSEGNP